MTQILDNLVALLSLEPIEENLFRGMSQDLGFRQLYGGQVLGQALSAASQTVEDDRHVHSMHGYFLRPGDASMPVVYQVDRVRDGGSFSTRRVTAIQKGQPIFTLSSSFQYDEEGFHHQIEMPEVVGPDNLPSELELTRQRAERIPERIRDKLLYPKPIEIRPVTQHDPYDPQPDEPVKYLWFRADGKLPDVGAAQVPAGLRLGFRFPYHLDAAPCRFGVAEDHAGRQPRPRPVVPPRPARGRVAALRHRQPLGRQRTRFRARQHLQPERPTGRLVEPGRPDPQA